MSSLSSTDRSESYKTRKKRNQRRKKRKEKRSEMELDESLDNGADISTQEIDHQDKLLDNGAEVSTQEAEHQITNPGRSSIRKKSYTARMPPGHKFVWPHLTEGEEPQCPQRIGKSRKEHATERLQENLVKMKDEYLLLHSRHKHCTHERMSRHVSMRTKMIVEAAVLSDGYSRHQPQLDAVPIKFFMEEQSGRFLSDKTMIYHMGNCKIYKDGEVLYKVYNEQQGMAVHEYRISHVLEELGVPFTASTLGVVQLSDRVPHLLAMNFYGIDGCLSSAERLISRNHTLTSADWVRVVWSVLLFLDSLHTAGYVHNKIWPENVIVSSCGGTKLGVVCDLQYCCLESLAKPLTMPQLSYLAHNMFTAPELRLGKPPSFATDMFALGSLISYLTYRTCLPKVFKKVASACMESPHSERISAASALRWFEESVHRLEHHIEKPVWNPSS